MSEDVGPAADEGAGNAGGVVSHPTCKVCGSPNRREIELALLVGGSRQAIADRFSVGGEVFNRQNIHTHFHHHMQVIDRALIDLAVAERKRRSLDLGTAQQVLLAKRQLLEDLLEMGLDAIAEGRVKWTLNDVLAVNAELEKLRATDHGQEVAYVVAQAHEFTMAVLEFLPDDKRDALVEAYQRRTRNLAKGTLWEPSGEAPLAS